MSKSSGVSRSSGSLSFLAIGSVDGFDKIYDSGTLRSHFSSTEFDKTVQLLRARYIAPEVQSEDRRLLNWRHWLKRRLKDQERFQWLSKEERHRSSMVYNSGDDRRYILEDKALLEEARTLIEPDPARGHPDFWKTAWQLSDQNNPCLPICSAPQRRPLPREFVGVPIPIRDRQGLWNSMDDPRAALQRWKSLKYRHQREAELRRELNLLAPHRPDTTTLMLEGTKVQKPTELTCCSAPTITVTPPMHVQTGDEGEERTEDVYDEPTEAPSKEVLLKIRDDLVRRSDSKRSYHMVFESAVGHIDKQSLRVENLSAVAVRRSWVRVAGESRGTGRFFLLSEPPLAVFLPGQVHHVEVAFRSRRAGIYREAWHMRTSPALPDIQLRLWGLCWATPVSTYRIEHYLARRVAEEVCRRTVKEANERASDVPPAIPPLWELCSDRELFEAANPAFKYSAAPAAALQTLYAAVCGEAAPRWNFSVSQLRRLIIETLQGDELEAALSELSRCCQQLLDENLEVPSVGDLQLFTAARAIWCQLAESVAADADQLRYCWDLPSRQLGFFLPEIIIQPTSPAVGTAKSSKGGVPAVPSVIEEEEEDVFETLPSPQFLGRRHGYLNALFVRVRRHINDSINGITAACDSHRLLLP